MKQRGQFASKFGILAAAVGSAVGLGNIWKFPYIAGANGGGAFLLVYIGCVLLLGFPALMTEMAIGRMAQVNPVGAFKKLTGHHGWTFIGVMGVLASFLVMAFYFVVAGWSLEYIWQSVSTLSFNGLSTEQLSANFTDFSTASTRPYIWLAVFVFITAFVIYLGVTQGIEKGSKILMPLLFLVVFYLMIHAFFLPNSGAGYSFYLKPDFSKITPSVVLQALGQSFFSLSIGIGIMLTYGSYIKEGNIVTTSFQISILDTLIAFMAGLVIFPAVFAYGIEPGQGPELAFIALPAVFSQMTGGIIFSVLFFFLLAVAALTSTISLYEAVVATFSENFNMRRGSANVLTGVLVLIASLICCHSLSGNSTFVFFGKGAFDWCDYLTSDFLLPIGGFFMAIFLGWFFDRERLHEALVSFGMKEWFFRIYLAFIRFIIPILILFVMLQQFGIFG